MTEPTNSKARTEQIKKLYDLLGGNISAISRKLDIARSTVRDHLRKLAIKKPIAGGTLHGAKKKNASLPQKGTVKRYILTSAQNNTYIHEAHWNNLLTLAGYYNAQILVGTFSYNQNAFSALAVKRGRKKPYEKELWYDSRIEPYICDRQVQLGNSLVWCGGMNIMPTAVNPLSGLETYTHRKSAIFPHVKLAMRSIAAMQGSLAKLNYTTGAVTLKNYIQKKEGLKAEAHHSYSALLVEVNDSGNWFVRQIHTDTKGVMFDLDLMVSGGKVTTGHRVEAITWGDLHATAVDESVFKASMSMLDTLKPRHQFLHDIMEGNAINHHRKDNPHFKFHVWLLGYHRLEAEMEVTKRYVEQYDRPWVNTIVVDSNHDDAWLQRWLREYDYRKDPPNTELFLRAQSYMYRRLSEGSMPRDVNMLEWFMRDSGLRTSVRFLVSDESYLLCNKRIECGMHGHLGPNGKQGAPTGLSEVGRRANTAHTHSAGIYNGLYVAGTSSKLRWDYNKGPSSWSHSHIVTYPNGARSIVTVYNGMWRGR